MSDERLIHLTKNAFNMLNGDPSYFENNGKAVCDASGVLHLISVEDIALARSTRAPCPRPTCPWCLHIYWKEPW